jgi:hypothetical protein
MVQIGICGTALPPDRYFTAAERAGSDSTRENRIFLVSGLASLALNSSMHTNLLAL